MTIYISGATTDTGEKEIECIKTQISQLGCKVCLPSINFSEKLPWAENIKKRLSCLQKSGAIYMLPQWKDSMAARIELTVAMNDKMPACFSIEDLKQFITTLGS